MKRIGIVLQMGQALRILLSVSTIIGLFASAVDAQDARLMPRIELRRIERLPSGPPPNGVQIVATTHTTATLVWQAASGAIGYSIYRLGGTPVRTIAATATPITSTSFKDSGLTPGKSYSWTVAAIYPISRRMAPGESAPVSANTLPPVRVCGFQAQATAGGEVTLNWNPVPEAAFYWLSGSGFDTQKVTATTFKVSGLTTGTHNYTIMAYYNTQDSDQNELLTLAKTSVAIAPLEDIHVDTLMPVSGALPPKPEYKKPPKIQSDGSVGTGTGTGTISQPLAVYPEKMWNPGDTLRVRMTGGSAIVRSKVRQYAVEWSRYANINFAFVDDSQPAEIKISFDKGSSWSVTGREALGVPFNFSTMNFGWFDDNTSDAEFSRVVLHEFGHALSLIHEHQSPVSGIPWDKEKTYRWYKEKMNWDKGKVDSQVFEKYSVTSTNYSQFDPTSIMAYWVPAELTLNGQGISGNTTLSSVDKQYIREWYPRPEDAKGTLRPEDCDDVKFKVEYDVVSADQVTFVLNSGATVTWWKSVKVPTGGSGYSEIEVTNGSSSEQTVSRSDMDNSRPIRFSKAKFFGIHTMLGKPWDIIPHLPGGSRVTFTWEKDSC